MPYYNSGSYGYGSGNSSGFGSLRKYGWSVQKLTPAATYATAIIIVVIVIFGISVLAPIAIGIIVFFIARKQKRPFQEVMRPFLPFFYGRRRRYGYGFGHPGPYDDPYYDPYGPRPMYHHHGANPAMNPAMNPATNPPMTGPAAPPPSYQP